MFLFLSGERKCAWVKQNEREAICLACPWPPWANTGSQSAGEREKWIKETCTNCEQFLSVKAQWQLAASSYLLPALDENKNIINSSGKIRDFDTKGNLETFSPYEKKIRKTFLFDLITTNSTWWHFFLFGSWTKKSTIVLYIVQYSTLLHHSEYRLSYGPYFLR